MNYYYMFYYDLHTHVKQMFKWNHTKKDEDERRKKTGEDDFVLYPSFTVVLDVTFHFMSILSYITILKEKF